jgi:hypothetical protein
MDLHDGSLTDERDSEDEPGHAVLAQELTPNAHERAAHHFDVHALDQERVRIVLEGRSCEALDRFDLGVGHGLGTAAGADEVGHADHVEDPQALDEREAGEAIAGEERKRHLLATIFPPAPPLDDGQKGLDLATRELVTNRFLVTRAGAYDVPEGDTPRVQNRAARIPGKFRCLKNRRH